MNLIWKYCGVTNIICCLVCSSGDVQPRVGTHIDMVYVYVPASLGRFFADFSIAIGGFSSQMKAPKLHKLNVFWANAGKKHPILEKFGAFCIKLVYWWVIKWHKIRYSESQNFEVRQAHPRNFFFFFEICIPPHSGPSSVQLSPSLSSKTIFIWIVCRFQSVSWVFFNGGDRLRCSWI